CPKACTTLFIGSPRTGGPSPATSCGLHDVPADDRHPRPAGECEAAERSVPALRAEPRGVDGPLGVGVEDRHVRRGAGREAPAPQRSEEHTSELQSRGHLVCRLLLEKKKKNKDR